MLLQALLAGLVAKLRFYTLSGIAGYTATIRGMYKFVKAKNYPKCWWLRPMTYVFLRAGVPVQCLPRQLRAVLPTQPTVTADKDY